MWFSGKTTILRLIYRLSKPDSGDILLNGNDIKESQLEERRQKVGMVFQEPVVFQGSVMDNLSFGMELWTEDIDLEVLARDTGIPEHLLDADIGKLSKGEKQKVHHDIDQLHGIPGYPEGVKWNGICNQETEDYGQGK